MKKLKVAVLVLVILTVALTIATIYCSWAIGRELSKYGRQNGLFVDPTFDFLKPFRSHILFLQYVWIAFAIVGATWIIIGAIWLKKRTTPEV